MKKLLFFLLFTGASVYGRAQAADPYVLIDVQPSTVKLGDSADLYVNVCDLGANSIVANSVFIRITAGVNAEITGFSTTQSSDNRFTIVTDSSTTGNGNVIVLTNSGGTLTDLGGADPCADIYLKVKGTVISGLTEMKAVISYIVGPNPLLGGAESITQGDKTGNNTSSSFLSVANLLPVHLASFTAAKTDGHTALNWQYNNAMNFSHFELERSTDGIRFSNFTNKQYKPANGQTSVAVKFTETDMSPFNGMNYYRLKMVDIDGAYTYSYVLKVDFTRKTTGINVYPNPARDQVTVETAGALRNGKIKVYNTNGAVVYQANATAITLVSTAVLPEGIYLVEVFDEQGTRLGSSRFLKVK